MTVYGPGIATVIEAEEALLLQSKEPVNPDADNNELPQLLVTVTIGVAGVGFGEATTLPSALIHPFTD